jgi:protein-S-isoprenylcysteine O-methyltransferase Ste14
MFNTIHALFNNRRARKLFLKLRVVLMIALVIAIAHYARPEWLLAGFAVSMLGQAIQLWSFASLVKNEELTARGPYVTVRNPMYLGRYFLILGFVVVTGNVWAALAYTVFYYFYMANRVKREEVVLAGLLGAPYAAYCQNVNRFVPTFTKLADPAVRFFDFSVLRHNNGHWNLFGTLIAWIVLYIYVVIVRQAL